MSLYPATQFNPKATAGSLIDPQARLQALQGLYQAHPGRRPGGSGDTGLAKNDAQGWSDMLGEQQEYQSLLNFSQGRSPEMHVQQAPMQEQHIGSSFGALPSTYNPSFQHSALQGGPLQGLQGAMPPGYQSHNQFMQNNPAAQAYQQRRQPAKPPTSGGY